MMNIESVYCVVFSKQAKLVNFIPAVRNCFQNRRERLSGNILAIVSSHSSLSSSQDTGKLCACYCVYMHN